MHINPFMKRMFEIFRRLLSQFESEYPRNASSSNSQITENGRHKTLIDFLLQCTMDSENKSSMPLRENCTKIFYQKTQIYYLLDVFQQQLTLSHVSKAFNKTESLMAKIIQCYAGEIHVIKAQDLTKIPFPMKNFLMTILMVFCVLSIMGNGFLIKLFIPKLFICCHRNTKITNITSERSRETAKKVSNLDLTSRNFDMYYVIPSILDLFFTIFILPYFLVTIFYDGIWMLSDTMCKVHAYFANLVFCVTSFTLVTMSVARYMAITKTAQMKPSWVTRFFNFLHNKVGILILISVYLVVSVLVALPYLLYTRNLAIVYNPGGCLSIRNYICLNIWNANELTEFFYEIGYWVLIFILPGFVLLFTYGSIAWFLFIRKPIGLIQIGNMRGDFKRRIIKVLILDSLFYVVCWFPFAIWSIKVCFDSFSKVFKINTRSHFMNYSILYSLALMNVTLKWVFRVFATLPRIRDKLKCCRRNKFKKINRKVDDDTLFYVKTPVRPIQQQSSRVKLHNQCLNVNNNTIEISTLKKTNSKLEKIKF